MSSFEEALRNKSFCVSKEGGQGFVDKTECTCKVNGEPTCQANEDKMAFLDRCEELRGENESYEGVIMKVREEFKDSAWVRDNVDYVKRFLEGS